MQDSNPGKDVKAKSNLKFYKLPVEIAHTPHLTSTAKIIYAYLYTVGQLNHGLVKIGINALADKFDLSARGIGRIAQELKDAGLIQSIRTGRTNVYNLPVLSGQLFQDADGLFDDMHKSADMEQKCRYDMHKSADSPLSYYSRKFLKKRDKESAPSAPVSLNKVGKFLDLLESQTMIEQKRDTKMTYLTICNYDTYQGGENEKRHQNDIKMTSKRHQNDTNKNDKNDKNDKNKEGGKKRKRFSPPTLDFEFIQFANRFNFYFSSDHLKKHQDIVLNAWQSNRKQWIAALELLKHQTFLKGQPFFDLPWLSQNLASVVAVKYFDMKEPGHKLREIAAKAETLGGGQALLKFLADH